MQQCSRRVFLQAMGRKDSEGWRQHLGWSPLAAISKKPSSNCVAAVSDFSHGRKKHGCAFCLERQARQGWGSKIIERLARDLRKAFPEMKGFSRANLLYTRAFSEA